MYLTKIETTDAKSALNNRPSDIRAINTRVKPRFQNRVKPVGKATAFREITPEYVDRFLQKMDALAGD